MTMTRTILDWTKKNYDEIDCENNKHPYLKAVGLGAIEGAIDGAVLMYVPVLISCYLWRKKAKQK